MCWRGFVHAWDEPPRVIGHRGSPREAPENTLASFRAAAAQGARAVELDARLTRDGHVVVHHDAEVGRIFDGEGLVEALAWEEVQALRLGARFHPRFLAERVPSLREVLDAFPAMLVNVELKADAANAPELAERAAHVVLEASAQGRVLFTSFDPELADAAAHRAAVPGGIILPFPPSAEDLDAWPRLRHVALAAEAAEDVAVQEALAKGRVLLAWTVNDAEEAAALLARGFAGVITDRPGALARQA